MMTATSHGSDTVDRFLALPTDIHGLVLEFLDADTLFACQLVAVSWRALVIGPELTAVWRDACSSEFPLAAAQGRLHYAQWGRALALGRGVSCYTTHLKAHGGAASFADIRSYRIHVHVQQPVGASLRQVLAFSCPLSWDPTEYHHSEDWTECARVLLPPVTFNGDAAGMVPALNGLMRTGEAPWAQLNPRFPGTSFGPNQVVLESNEIHPLAYPDGALSGHLILERPDGAVALLGVWDSDYRLGEEYVRLQDTICDEGQLLPDTYARVNTGPKVEIEGHLYEFVLEVESRYRTATSATEGWVSEVRLELAYRPPWQEDNWPDEHSLDTSAQLLEALQGLAWAPRPA